jgi:hypothetical protein
MAKLRLLAIVGALGALGSAAGASTPPGQAVLEAAFDPDRSFAGDIRPSSDDEMVLTARASARDDYAPDYSLAIAYRCFPTQKAGEWSCRFVARMLRVGGTGNMRFGASLKLAAQAGTAESGSEMRHNLSQAKLEWLEADVNACPKGIFAMDSVRVADWRPDIHYALQEMKDRELVVHPAQIHVWMHGTYTTSRYQGWVAAAGVPAAVRTLLETLEPCWKPATSPRPWDRR